MAAVFTMIDNPRATTVSEEAMQRAALCGEFYLGEALRLAGVQPLHDKSDQAAMLWCWLALRGKRYISLPELVQFGPAKLRKADTMRNVMCVLADHYMVRKVPDAWSSTTARPAKKAGRCGYEFQATHTRARLFRAVNGC